LPLGQLPRGLVRPPAKGKAEVVFRAVGIVFAGADIRWAVLGLSIWCENADRPVRAMRIGNREFFSNTPYGIGGSRMGEVP
jgi:hypothetical protein